MQAGYVQNLVQQPAVQTSSSTPATATSSSSAAVTTSRKQPRPLDFDTTTIATSTSSKASKLQTTLWQLFDNIEVLKEYMLRIQSLLPQQYEQTLQRTTAADQLRAISSVATYASDARLLLFPNTLHYAREALRLYAAIDMVAAAVSYGLTPAALKTVAAAKLIAGLQDRQEIGSIIYETLKLAEEESDRLTPAMLERAYSAVKAYKIQSHVAPRTQLSSAVMMQTDAPQVSKPQPRPTLQAAASSPMQTTSSSSSKATAASAAASSPMQTTSSLSSKATAATAATVTPSTTSSATSSIFNTVRQTLFRQ